MPKQGNGETAVVEEVVLETFSYVQLQQLNAVEIQKAVVLIVIDVAVLQNAGVHWGTPGRFSPVINSQEQVLGAVANPVKLH